MASSRAWVAAAVVTIACVRAPRAVSSVEQLPSRARVLSQLDGAPVPVAQLVAQRPVTVVAFFSTDCPCVARYQARVEALAAEDVQVVFVSSNADEAAATLATAAKTRGLTAPLLADWDGAFAAAVGARSTPTIVVFDRTGAIHYRGWLDNERLPGESGREAYVERAVAQLRAGKPVTQPASATFGCPITRTVSGAEAECRVPLAR